MWMSQGVRACSRGHVHQRLMLLSSAPKPFGLLSAPETQPNMSSTQPSLVTNWTKSKRDTLPRPLMNSNRVGDAFTAPPSEAVKATTNLSEATNSGTVLSCARNQQDRPRTHNRRRHERDTTSEPNTTRTNPPQRGRGTNESVHGKAS